MRMAERRRRRVGQAMRHLLQYLRFGSVGLVATVVHVLAFVTLIELAATSPLLANLLAFALAVLVSFGGHRRWTFRPEAAGPRHPKAALLKFILVALLGLTLNSLAVYLITELLDLSYRYALLVMIGIVPLIVFLLSKHWVFAGSAAGRRRCDLAY